jgi:hypothetical protein
MFVRRDLIRGAGLVIATGALSPLALRALARDVDPQQMQLHNYGQASDLRLLDPSSLATPPHNFDSNHNYFIYGGGQPIVGLVVTIEVTEDMVAPQGMSMQLNCNSPKTAGCAYQQYVTGFSPNTPTLAIGASIENFPTKPFRWTLHQNVGLPCGPAPDPTEETCKGDIIAQLFGKFGVFPGANDTVPAGFKIRYDLLSDSDGTITGANYTLTNKHGETKTTGPQMLRSFKFDHTDKPVGPHALAPILAAQMNLVGVSGGRRMNLTSGAGTITYEARTPLTPEGAAPSTINAVGTEESSNIQYAQLSSSPSTTIVQKFRAVTS